MAIEYTNGILIWVLYSKKTGDIFKATKYPPSEKEKPPLGKVWGSFIVTKKVFENIYKYSVTYSGIEKKINKFLVVR